MKRTICFPLIAFFFLMTGCGGSSDKLAPTQVLTVMIDGKPAVGISMTLLSADNKIVGAGSTGNDGKVAIRGKDDQPMQAGTFKVIVTDIGETEENPMASQKVQKSRIPAIYTNPNNTPLKVTIEQGKMDYTIEIKTTR